MRAIPQALMWELFWHGRGWIPAFYVLGNLMPMLLFLMLTHVGLEPQDPVFLLLHVCFMPIILICVGGGILPAQGAFSRLYSAPISTASLVAWHLFPGGIILAIEIALSVLMYNWLFHLNWPILGPALVAAAAWASVQTLVSTSQKTLSGICLTGAPCLVLLKWAHARYGGWFSDPTHYWTVVTPVEAATLLGVVVVAYAVTVTAVARDRCGEPLPSLGGWKWITREWDALTTTSVAKWRPFRSAAHAQFWFDWTWKGLALPLVVVLGYLIGIMGWLLNNAAGHGTDVPLEEFCRGILAGGGMLTLVAGAAGILSSIPCDGTSGKKQHETMRDLIGHENLHGMGHFQSTRPFTNADFAKSILLAATSSILIGWALWFAGLVICLLIAVSIHQKLTVILPSDFGAWYLPLTLLGPWIAMTNSATIGLSGRAAKLILAGVMSVISYCIVLFLIKEFVSREAHDRFVESCVCIGSIAVVLSTLPSFSKAYRCGYLNRRTACAAAGFAISIVVMAIALQPRELSMTAYFMICAFAALVVLPIATTPLAIAWNRHR
ncbi:MAG: hypothetical protein R3C17_11130 [Planctomycetaceae bacterium]